MAVQSYGGGIVTHVYDGTVQYTSRAFQFRTEGNPGSLTYFTHPQAPTRARPESVLMYNGNPRGFSLERVLRQIVPGQDGRSRIQNTTDSPYCIHAQLTPVFAGQEYGGSGVMIGPHHVLTCGHNVYDFDTRTWASSISVYPALNGGPAPFGVSHVVRVYTFADWTNRKDTNFDIAILVLNRSVGKYTGWGGVMSTHDNALTNQRVHITGYPGDKNSVEMWTMEHIMDALLPETLRYRIDTYFGQSGSAIWFLQQGSPMIVGVHTSGIDDQINWGTRISYQKFTEFVVRILGETRKINKPNLPRQIPLPVAANPAPKNAGGNFAGLHQAPPAAVAMPLPPLAPPAAIPVIPAQMQPSPFVAALDSAIPGKPAGAPSGEEEYRKALAIDVSMNNPHYVKNLEAKFSLLKAASEKRYPAAMGKLGDCYRWGSGVEINYPEAFRWYHLGTENGDLYSEYQLGSCYIHGVHVTKDADTGVRLACSAVQKGHPDTFGYLLHPKYDHIKNAPRPATPVIPAQVRTAAPAKPAAAPPGEEEYRRALATDNNIQNIHNYMKNLETRFTLFRAAAEKGYPPAMGKLGDCYRGFGEGGVEKSTTEAIRLYRQGVKNGDPHSEYQLGNCYMHGVGVPVNYEEGIRLIGSAIQKGYPNLGNWIIDRKHP